MATWTRYTAATLAVLAIAGLRLLLLGPGPGHAFFTFMPAVIAASAFLDRGTGIYASFLSAAVGLWLFVEPVGLFSAAYLVDLMLMVAFLGFALGSALLLETLHGALVAVAEERHRRGGGDGGVHLQARTTHGPD